MGILNTKAEPEAVDVVMVTESGFPYVKGGVGGVINQMLTGMPETKFGLIHIAWDRSSTRSRKYEIPRNVLWIKDIYLAPDESPSVRNRTSLTHARSVLSLKSRMKTDVEPILRALDTATTGDYSGMRRMYRDYLNPKTKVHDLRDVLRTPDCMLAFERHFAGLGLSLTRTFWILDNFITILTRLATEEYPEGLIYHSQTQLYAGLVAAIAAAQHDRPMLLTEHGLNIRDSLAFVNGSALHPVEKGLWIRWFRHIGQFVYEEAAFATYQFERNVQEAEATGLDRSKVRMISNGIKLEDFAHARTKNESRATGKNAPWKIAYAGRIVEAKGILDLIDAIEMMTSKTDVEIRVQMIGPADGSEDFLLRCEELVKNRGLNTIITFPGPRNLSEAFGDVDILVLPTHTDALPIVLLEAMASAVPVVATEVGAIMEIIADPVTNPGDPANPVGPAGLVVPPRKPTALAAAISLLIKNQEFYESCRKNGPRRIEINHRADKIMAQYMELYNSLYHRATRRQNTVNSGNVAKRLATGTSRLAAMADETSKRALNDSKVMSTWMSP